jgi:hypothetical protein
MPMDKNVMATNAWYTAGKNSLIVTIVWYLSISLGLGIQQGKDLVVELKIITVKIKKM